MTSDAMRIYVRGWTVQPHLGFVLFVPLKWNAFNQTWRTHWISWNTTSNTWCLLKPRNPGTQTQTWSISPTFMAQMASVGRTDATSQKPSPVEINLPGERPAWIGWGEMVYVINRNARNWSILEAWHQPQISVFLLLAVSGMDVIQDELIPPQLSGNWQWVLCALQMGGITLAWAHGRAIQPWCVGGLDCEIPTCIRHSVCAYTYMYIYI